MPPVVSENSAVAREVTLDLWRAVLDARPLPLDADWWDDRLLERVFAEPTLTIQLLRFVAAGPSLKSSSAVVRQFRSLHRELRRLDPSARPLVDGLDEEGSLIDRAVTVGAGLLRERIGRRFVVTPERLGEFLLQASRAGVSATLRPAGHRAATASDAERYVAAVEGLLLEAAEAVAPPRVLIDVEILTAGLPRGDAKRRRERLVGSLTRLADRAEEAESGLIASAGNDADRMLLSEIVAETDGPVALAVPADSAIEIGERVAWLSPGRPDPHDADAAAYDEAESEFVRSAIAAVESDASPALATCDPRLIGELVAATDEPGRLEFAMPLGVGDALVGPLLDLGVGVRLEVPVGAVGPTLAAEASRLLRERPVGRSLRPLTVPDPRRGPDAGSTDETDLLEPLLTSPPVPSSPALDEIPVFTPEPRADFADATTHASMEAALEELSDGSGDTLAWIEGRAVQSRRWVDLADPSAPKTVFGRVTVTTPEQGTAAVAAARSAADSWGKTAAAERVELVELAAAELRLRRYEFAATLVREAGLSWEEADGEAAGAIDRLRLAAGTVRDELSADSTPLRGTARDAAFVPRGVTAIFPGTDSPLAAPCGYVAASLVTGNPAVVCSAGGGYVASSLLAQVLRTAGVPSGVLNVVPRSGDGVAAAIAGGEVDLIAADGDDEAFREVAGAVSSGGRLPWVFGEPGRVGTAIVDEDADLDAAATALAGDAFGAAGGRPFGVTRVAVPRSRVEEFVARLGEIAGDLPVGPATDGATAIGPCRVAKAARTAAEAAGEHGEVAFEGTAPGGKRGPFVPPRVVTGLPLDSRFAEEGFAGPTVAVFAVNDFDAAMTLASRGPAGATRAVGYWGRRDDAGERIRSAAGAAHVVVNAPLTGPRTPLLIADPRTLLPYFVRVVTVRSDAGGRGY